MAAAVVNTTGKTISYGVLGTFQRWTGTAWTSPQAWSTSLDQWGGFPVAGGSSVSVFAIGLGAPAHGVGPVQYFSVPALSEGWYRVGYPGGKTQPVAYGIIRVTPSAPKPVPIDNPQSPSLIAYPTLVREGQDVGLVGFPPNQGAQTANEVDEFNHGLSTGVAIQRWDGSAWVTFVTETVHQAKLPLSNTYEVAVTLPGLPSGTYRLVRHSATAGDVARVVWVVHSLPMASTS
jgi:hypothetical protein